MTIEVLGSGCAKCKKLHEQTQAAAVELGLKTDVLYSTDIEKIIALGVMSSPVLAINGKPVLVGMVPAVHAIKELLAEHATMSAEGEGCCSGKDACHIRCAPQNQNEGGSCSCDSC